MGRGHNYATCLEGALVSIGCVSSHIVVLLCFHSVEKLSFRQLYEFGNFVVFG